VPVVKIVVVVDLSVVAAANSQTSVIRGSTVKVRDSVSISSKIFLPVREPAIGNRQSPVAASANEETAAAAEVFKNEVNVAVDFKKEANVAEVFRNEAIAAVVFKKGEIEAAVSINTAFNKEIFQTFIIRVPFADVAVLDVVAAVFTVR
jgi:hypothetical protein